MAQVKTSGFVNPMTTKGDLIAATTGGTPARATVGADNQILVADSTQTDGVSWQTPGTSNGIGNVVHPGGPSTDGDFTFYLGTSGKRIQDLGYSPSSDGTLAANSDSLIPTQQAVKTAINNAIAGVNPAVAVQAATTAASDTSGLTYANGVSGIGATLTGPVATALTVDGFTFNALGQRLLVKNDTQSPSGAFNGVYYVTQLQTGILPLILTRALDYDQSSDINNTGTIPVVNGTANALTSWLLTSSVTTVGTDPLTYSKFSINPSTLPVGANPSAAITGTVINGSATTFMRSDAAPALTFAAGTFLQGDGLTSAQVGFRNIPQRSSSVNTTTVAADSGGHLLHPASDANARTFTIDSNANVPCPVGTAITFVNQTSQVLSIAITSDTLTLAGTTTTGTRSLAQNGVATALKVASTSWIASGTGLT